jgi:hypothetical protein
VSDSVAVVASSCSSLSVSGGWAGSSVLAEDAWASGAVADNSACAFLLNVAADLADASSLEVAVDSAGACVKGYSLLTNLPCWFLDCLDLLLMQSVTKRGA